MSHSVPSESSTIDTTFLVGTDLVEFDHRELPIYQTPDARWAEACFDEAPYGAPLDRLFGEPGEPHIDGVLREEPQDIAALGHEPLGHDPLVTLPSPSDGLILPGSEGPLAAHETAAHTHAEIAPIFDFGADAHAADAHAIVHLHDGWTWDASSADWTFGAHS
jgi:hypothetical protein